MRADEHVAFWSCRPTHRRYGLADPLENPLVRMGWKIHMNRAAAWARENCTRTPVALFQAGLS